MQSQTITNPVNDKITTEHTVLNANPNYEEAKFDDKGIPLNPAGTFQSKNSLMQQLMAKANIYTNDTGIYKLIVATPDSHQFFTKGFCKFKNAD